MMENLSRLTNESLIEFADRLASIYNHKNSKLSKKDKGQFFTPTVIAKHIASFADISKKEISILDPGAGVGILSIALIEKLLMEGKVKKISLVCYETDIHAIPYLKVLLEETISSINGKISLDYTIIDEDFVLSKANVLNNNLTNYNPAKEQLFDIVISNPPYFKLCKKDFSTVVFKDIISGQPNIYFLFMAISSKLLKDEGEMIFITPRSFCSGLYYSKFRTWLIEKVNFANIHLFDSRKELFVKENVLQENIITKFTKKQQDKITISKTFNGDFSNGQKINVLIKDVIYRSNGHIFFRIPSNEEELKTIRELDRLPHNFYKLGIKISTGKVVAFRNKDYLQKSITKDSVPLLWMHNIKNGRIEWPVSKKDKAIAISNNKDTKWLLLQASNYLVLKRFTTKEQKRRFETACIFKEDFEKYGCFALDNMVNYIYRPNYQLSENQIKGIAKYLVLPIVDSYFRILNGHTQVNANEVYALPFPSLDQLEMFGKSMAESTSILKTKGNGINNSFHKDQTIASSILYA